MSDAPTAWVARRPARWSRWGAVAVLELTALAIESYGLAGMNRFPRVAAGGETFLYFFYGGFGVQLLVMFLVIAMGLRVVHVAVSDHAIQFDGHQLPRATATVRVAAYQRFGRSYRVLQLSSPERAWNLRTRASRGEAARLAAAPSRIDGVLSRLDFQEMAALLDPGSTAALPAGLRFDLAPYRASAMSALSSAKPWFLTMLVLGVAGPTLGPLIARSPVGLMLLTPVTMLMACAAIAATIVAYHRPRDGLRVTLGADAITLADTDAGAIARTAALSAVRAECFHYALFGKYDRLTNPGLRLVFPDGFTLALAIPLAERRWSQRVPRAWAPRWTLDAGASRSLLKAFHLA